jgi:hypothetical protein
LARLRGLAPFTSCIGGCLEIEIAPKRNWITEGKICVAQYPPNPFFRSIQKNVLASPVQPIAPAGLPVGARPTSRNSERFE